MFGGQARHAEDAVAAMAVEYVPATQLLHVEAPASEYVPAPQLVQAPEPVLVLNLPAAHETHDCASGPVEPAGHAPS